MIKFPCGSFIIDGAPCRPLCLIPAGEILTDQNLTIQTNSNIIPVVTVRTFLMQVVDIYTIVVSAL